MTSKSDVALKILCVAPKFGEKRVALTVGEICPSQIIPECFHDMNSLIDDWSILNSFSLISKWSSWFNYNININGKNLFGTISILIDVNKLIAITSINLKNITVDSLDTIWYIRIGIFFFYSTRIKSFCWRRNYIV